MWLWLFLFSAVGIQMKLEFFQRKFWTACRQVTTTTYCVVFYKYWASWVYVKLNCVCFVLSVQLWMESAALAVIMRWEQSLNSGLWFSFSGSFAVFVFIIIYSLFWQDINCYLIDNNGFILVTEEQSQVLCACLHIHVSVFTWTKFDILETSRHDLHQLF